MAITVDATIGGANANAYIDVAAADQIAEYRQQTFAIWSALTADEKGAALIGATSLLDDLQWNGVRTAETQALRWPRAGVVDQDDYVLDDDIIPKAVQEAVTDLAYSLSQSDAFQATGLEGLSEIGVDVIKLKLDKDDREDAIPSRILDRLQWLLKGRASGSMGAAAVVRT